VEFSYYKQAALNTLRIAEEALKHGMMLKDASAFNMQCIDGRMQLIDTLSFINTNPYAVVCIPAVPAALH